MHAAKFTSRHIGPREEDQKAMLRTIGVASMEYSKTETLASVTVGGSKADGDDE